MNNVFDYLIEKSEKNENAKNKKKTEPEIGT